jgi:hypothetical protein
MNDKMRVSKIERIRLRKDGTSRANIFIEGEASGILVSKSWLKSNKPEVDGFYIEAEGGAYYSDVDPASLYEENVIGHAEVQIENIIAEVVDERPSDDEIIEAKRPVVDVPEENVMEFVMSEEVTEATKKAKIATDKNTKRKTRNPRKAKKSVSK